MSAQRPQSTQRKEKGGKAAHLFFLRASAPPRLRVNQNLCALCALCANPIPNRRQPSTTAAKFASDEFNPASWSFAEIPGGT